MLAATPRTMLGAAVLSALVVGGVLALGDARGLMLVAAVVLAALAAVSHEHPILLFGVLAGVLALVPEDGEDNRLGLTYLVHGNGIWLFSVPVIFLILLTGILLAQQLPDGVRRWPGAPATIAAALLGIALASALLYPEVKDNLFVVRPLVVLLLAILCGYWIALQYGSRLPLTVLVWAAVLALPVGFYNIATGRALSYYDASFPYLLGVAVILVSFRAVEIGVLRWPFIVLALMVIVLSLRRGAMIAIAIGFLLTGLVTGRGRFWALVVGAAGVLLLIEVVVPGALFSRIEQLASYLTGASGQDENVNYRKQEAANAWIEVQRHLIWGIGPSADWTLYRTFEGKFQRLGPDYLHNSYLWVWLRFTIAGLVAYVAFFLSVGWTLVRRSVPVGAVAVGATTLGLVVSLGTASWITTTVRWPLALGLFVGIAIAAKREQEAHRPDLRVPARRTA